VAADFFDDEAELISMMIKKSLKGNELLSSLSECFVEDMRDGGMGSQRFLDHDHNQRRFDKKIAEAEFADEDGILVSAPLNLAEQGNLFELVF